MGLGVSHAPLVEGVRGHHYHRPLTYMRNYLEKMASAMYDAPAPTENPPIVLAALRQKMLALARDKADGAHPYFVPPAHTRQAREILGPGKLLAPAQAVILETDPAKARAAAREYMKTYVPRLPNYKNNLLELGYTEADLPTAAATASSTTSWPGVTWLPSKPASRSTTMPAPITSVFCRCQPRAVCPIWRP